jgi:hypothetical protein
VREDLENRIKQIFAQARGTGQAMAMVLALFQ